MTFHVRKLHLSCHLHLISALGGQTRVVIGEGKNKKVLAAADDDYFDDSMIVRIYLCAASLLKLPNSR